MRCCSFCQVVFDSQWEYCQLRKILLKLYMNVLHTHVLCGTILDILFLMTFQDIFAVIFPHFSFFLYSFSLSLVNVPPFPFPVFIFLLLAHSLMPMVHYTFIVFVATETIIKNHSRSKYGVVRSNPNGNIYKTISTTQSQGCYRNGGRKTGLAGRSGSLL